MLFGSGDSTAAAGVGARRELRMGVAEARPTEAGTGGEERKSVLKCYCGAPLPSCVSASKLFAPGTLTCLFELVWCAM